MGSRPRGFLIHALVTISILALALFIFSFFGGGELALGNLVLRTQEGVSYPLQAPKPSVQSSPRGDESSAPQARNVVLCIGDGMGIGHISAAADLLTHPGGTLAMVDTEFVGLVRTWAANTLVTDSAASGTALATGYKTDMKMVSVLADGSIPQTLFEAARDHGMVTGVITTSGLVDATPACFTTHVGNRDSYEEILPQMLASGTDVLIGGNWSGFKKAKRNRKYRDMEVDLERSGSEKGFNVIRDPDAIESTPLPILAVFPPRNRSGYGQQHGPPLAVSARHVIELFLEREKPFLLVIESEVTDSLAHENNIEALMEGMRELDEAVAEVLDLVAHRGDTLVLVTADHDTGSLAVTDGYYEDGRAMVRWATSEHSSQWVPLFAFGPGAGRFTGVLDNTEIAVLTARTLGFKSFPQLADFEEN
jgi:alkaline phosphatase